MRLLIVTQAVDLDDPVLGFFHRWIEELSKRCERVHVVCLKEGRHTLPQNVFVYSLGKERGASRLKYIARFYRYIWSFRREYDSVFVHMNQEYVLLGGTLWRIGGKKIVLWRNHKMGSVATRFAGKIANVVCYTSPGAFVAAFGNAVQMSIGIDTELFSPGGTPASRSILFIGRFDAVKRPDVFLEALEILEREGVAYTGDIYGDPTPGREAYAEELKKRFADLKNVSFHPGVRNDETPALYRAHELYVNLTPAGSFDKTIGEAMASGSVVVCTNDAVREVVPKELMAGDSAATVARAIQAALGLSEPERLAIAARQREYIMREHSLALLLERLAALLEQNGATPILERS